MRLAFVEMYHVVFLLAGAKTDASVIIAFEVFRKQMRSRAHGLSELLLPVFSGGRSACCFARWMRSRDQPREPAIPNRRRFWQRLIRREVVLEPYKAGGTGEGLTGHGASGLPLAFVLRPPIDTKN